MQFSLYNKKHTSLFVFIIAIFTILAPMPNAACAQQISSRQQRSNFERFEHYRTINRDSAYLYAERIANDIDSAVIGNDIAMMYDFMAEYAETSLHRYNKALNYRLRSAEMYEALDNQPCLTRTNALLGRMYLRNGDYHNAFSHSTKALGEAKRMGDVTSEREAYLVLEQVTYFYHNNVEKAMEYNRLVSESFENREQAHQAVRALNNRFNYLLSYDEAAKLTEQAEVLCDKYSFSDLLINIYLNASMLALEYNQMEDAAEYLLRAKPMLSNFKEEGYYYSASGFYNLISGNTSQAISDLKHSIELLGQEDFDTKNVHSFFLLQDIYFNQGRYREAYEALMAFAETYTRQYNTSNVVKLSLLINEMELAQADERLKQHQHEMEQKEKYNKLQSRLYIFGICLVTAIAILTLLLWRMQRKNSRLNSAKQEQELRYKNEIIKIQQLQQYEEQNNMEKLSDELTQAVNTSDNREMRTALRRIIRQLQKSHATSDNWAEVEKRLASTNDTFFENLLKEYPNLTKNERKLCTFIHMNLSTKEIANITHQSIGSINVARSRLRQKFGIAGDDKSLITFLDRFNTKAEE